MTDEKFKELVAAAQARYDALTPKQKAAHDYEQRRSFVRGMCPSRISYEKWCEVVEKHMPAPPQGADKQ